MHDLGDNPTDGAVLEWCFIRAGIVDDIKKVNDSLIIVHKANAAEQLEAALAEIGYKLTKCHS